MTVTCGACGKDWPMGSDEVQYSPDGRWFCTSYGECTDRSADVTETNEQFSQWCVLELMGHRRLAGLVSEQEIAGQAFLRLDIHRAAEVITQYYSPSAVYCITPTTEEVARKTAELGRPQPVARWEIAAPEQPDEDTKANEWLEDPF